MATEIVYVVPTDFKAEDMVITTPSSKKNKAGKEQWRAYINSNVARSVAYFTPRIYTPFGVSDYEGDGKFKLQACIAAADDQDQDAVNEVAAWQAELLKVDEAMKGWAKVNWEKIPCFKKAPSDEMIEEKYKPIVNVSDNAKYPTNKLKFNFGMTAWNENTKDEDGNPIAEDHFVPAPTFEVYDDQGNKIEVGSLSELPGIIPKGTRFRVCFTMSIWCVGTTGFGVKLNVQTIEISRRSGAVRPTGNPFQERSKKPAAESSYSSKFAASAAAPAAVKPAAAAAAAAKPAATAAPAKTQAPDSDDDEDGDDGEDGGDDDDDEE